MRLFAGSGKLQEAMRNETLPRFSSEKNSVSGYLIGIQYSDFFGFFMRPENIKDIFSVHIWLYDIGMTQLSLRSFALEAVVPYLQAMLETS